MNKFDHRLDFVRWDNNVLHKIDYIVSKVKTQYWKRTHKFGIVLSKPVPQELEIYKKNWNTFWKDAIEN